jgi:DNA-binding response OmpR family regulator
VNSDNRRILVIDDSNEAAESLALLLRLHGHDVRVAHDGPAGLAEADAWPPEVVLLDIGLPGGMDGYETARRLRAHRGESVRLVALTGCSDAEDDQRAQTAGFDLYLVKPAELADLRRAVAVSRG